MCSAKDRRHSGRKVVVIPHPEANPLEFEYWDDWEDYRDGQRAYAQDSTKLSTPDFQDKNLRMLRIRKARKEMQEC